jgi:hypothetical protein
VRGLHVETLWRALVLPVEHVLLGLLEVLVVHLSKSVTFTSQYNLYLGFHAPYEIFL